MSRKTVKALFIIESLKFEDEHARRGRPNSAADNAIEWRRCQIYLHQNVIGARVCSEAIS